MPDFYTFKWLDFSGQGQILNSAYVTYILMLRNCPSSAP